MGDRAPEERLLIELAIAAPLETVWRAIREPAIIRNWFGWDADTLADEIEYIFVQHAEPFEAAHMLQFGTWEGAADRFELAPIDGGTTLRVVRTAPALAPDWPEGYDEIVEGWITFVEQLRFLLERHAGATRRTIYLSGKAPERHRQPSSALGIDGLRDAANGSGYTAELPTGDRLTGIVWHRSRHQIGLAVDDWGGGLLVVTDRPKSDSAPHGGGAALLTTFGLADAGLAELEGRWRKWWEGRYPAGSVPVQP